jgi:LmbE family N-acetylglucosaminyl deacetylase
VVFRRRPPGAGTVVTSPAHRRQDDDMTSRSQAPAGDRPQPDLITDARELGTVLGIWAHPDDEAFLSAGLMAAARDNGQRVVCVTATIGERGTPDSRRWPPDRLGELRVHELRASLAALGVTEHHLLGVSDGGCAGAPRAIMVDRIARIAERVQPDTVVTFGPDGMTGHEDHQVVSSWATEAHAGAVPGARLLYATTTDEFVDQWEPVRDRFDAFLVDGLPVRTPRDALAVELRLDPRLVDRKLVALRAQASQTTAMIAELGEDRLLGWWAVEAFVSADRAAQAPGAGWGTWRAAA